MKGNRLRASLAGVALVATGLGACAPAPPPATVLTMRAGSSCQVRTSTWQQPYLHTRLWLEKTGPNCGLSYLDKDRRVVVWNKYTVFSTIVTNTSVLIKVRGSSTCQSLTAGPYGSVYAKTTSYCPGF